MPRWPSRLAITVSGGVGAAQEGDTPDSLIARADAALYSAKTAGRNRMFCHTGDGAEPVHVEQTEENIVQATGSGPQL